MSESNAPSPRSTAREKEPAALRPRVLFRADGSSRIGVGHIVRCASLASECLDRGAEVYLAYRGGSELPLWSLRLFPGETFEIDSSTLPVEDQEDPRAHAGSTEAKQMEDAGRVLELIRSRLPAPYVDWIVVDHYGLDASWHRAMEGSTQSILCIDDLANRALNADVVLDQNRDPKTAERDYAACVDPGTLVLAGPQWALVRKEFRLYRERESVPPKANLRVLVLAGGSDPGGLTERILRSLSEISHSLEVVVVLGDAERGGLVRELGSSLSHKVSVRAGDLDVASVMSGVDVAISAAGSTVWELCCMGIPMGLLEEAGNQSVVMAQAVAAGAARPLGSLSARELREFFDRARRGSSEWHSMSQAGLALVDGGGPGRVCDVMLQGPSEQCR